MTEVEPSLDERLRSAIDEFEQEHRSVWEQEPDVSEHWPGVVDDVALLLLSKTEKLEKTDRFRIRFETHEGETVHEFQLVDSKGLANFVGLFPETRERLQLLLAREYCLDTEGLAERCLRISGIALASRPESEKVVAYLRRLSRCYVLGLHPECVVLCRAVLEHAMKEVYSRTGRTRPRQTDDSYPTLKGDLDAAHTIYGWLSADCLRDAHTVRRKGNRALHKEVPSAEVAFETVRETMRVLDELYDAIGQ